MAWGLTFRISGSVFDNEKISWERADRGYQFIEKRFPDSARVRNQRAYVAVMGSRTKEQARGVIAELHGEIDPEIWADKDNFLSMTKNLYTR
jgi:hypothetical protein